MQEKDLDTRFEEAVEIANTMTQESLPQDTQLRLYAYYKHATGNTNPGFSPVFDLRNAFKTNARMQIINLSQNDAKEEYIKLINELNSKK